MEPIKHVRGAYGVKLNPAWVWPPSAAAESEPPIEPPIEGVLIDSVPLENSDLSLTLSKNQDIVGQYIKASGNQILHSVKFLLARGIGVTGTLTAVLIEGGGDGFPLIPLNTLAESDPVEVESLSDNDTLHEFVFPDDFQLVADAEYLIGLCFVGSPIGQVSISADSSNAHFGTAVTRNDASWSQQTSDIIFYLYAKP